ncbi:MAG: hypothetical protein IPJ68_00015 [Candidatus Moraniibacteriota bacterium]|nr:MAG: hypothetical protein IPJ68_00015 [Candidatus Moranbacteria bacterium]
MFPTETSPVEIVSSRQDIADATSKRGDQPVLLIQAMDAEATEGIVSRFESDRYRVIQPPNLYRQH